MKHQTAAILVIGNEVLSGRTRDANAWLAAKRLFENGCRLQEIAVVPDHLDAIAETLNRLRRHADAVITSGGIGPTHDDITLEAVAAAFAVPLVEDAAIVRAMAERFGPRVSRGLTGLSAAALTLFGLHQLAQGVGLLAP